jgi:CheY-like chemotaxis protein
MAAPKKKPPAQTRARAAPSPVFVLIVDDFADAREMYAEYFEFLGYKVSTAENGLEAIEKATVERPDLILMDLSLPVLDGWEATRRLKRDERTRDIPVIALTGNALAGHEEHARKAGCDSFLTKPCLPEDVEKEMRKILSVARRSVA